MNYYKIPDLGLLEEVIEAKRSYAKPNTIKYYVATLAKLREFLSVETGHAPSQQQTIEEDTCKNFATYLCANMKESSARAYLQQLAALFNDAWERGWIQQSPMPRPASLMPKRQAPAKESLSVEELMQLYSTPCCRESTRRAFLFSCFTGLSLSDIETFEFDHIHHDGHRLVIVKPLEKGGAETRIPLGRMAMGILEEIETEYKPTDDSHVFHLKDRSTITSDLRRWTADAQINKNVTFSYGRNTFCSLVLQAGIDEGKLARWNGNTSPVEASTNPLSAHSGINAFDNLFA